MLPDNHNTKIKRHEKIRTIIILRDDTEGNKFQKNSKVWAPLNVIGPRLLDSVYIIKSGTFEKKNWVYLFSIHFNVKNFVSILMTSLIGLMSL